MKIDSTKISALMNVMENQRLQFKIDSLEFEIKSMILNNKIMESLRKLEEITSR